MLTPGQLRAVDYISGALDEIEARTRLINDYILIQSLDAPYLVLSSQTRPCRAHFRKLLDDHERTKPTTAEKARP